MYFNPSSSKPWKAYGEVRGLKAPPRRIFAPPALAIRAHSLIWSNPSIEQGPAIVTKLPSPIFTPSTSTTVLPGWNSREVNLYVFKIRTAFSTPS